MSKFRKKPVVIEAFQVAGEGATSQSLPIWAIHAFNTGRLFYDNRGRLTCCTLEGLMRAPAGDWIIRGIKGELYPCKPDIFEETYEAVQE